MQGEQKVKRREANRSMVMQPNKEEEAGTDCVKDKSSMLLEGLRVNHAERIGNLGTNSAFAVGPRKTTENLDRVGRPQDPPDAI
jgi:hypothetical protein